MTMKNPRVDCPSQNAYDTTRTLICGRGNSNCCHYQMPIWRHDRSTVKVFFWKKSPTLIPRATYSQSTRGRIAPTRATSENRKRTGNKAPSPRTITINVSRRRVRECRNTRNAVFTRILLLFDVACVCFDPYCHRRRNVRFYPRTRLGGGVFFHPTALPAEIA